MLDIAFAKPSLPTGGAVAILLAEEDLGGGAWHDWDQALNGILSRGIAAAEFKARRSQATTLFAPGNGLNRIVLVGLGKRAELDAPAIEAACRALASGELVGVYPEATISRSFELKAFKSGAARMAIESGAPIVPTVIWGAQRVWTKGHPKQLGRTGYKISIGVCEPLEATGSADALTAKLHEVMSAKLLELQDAYGEHPKGEFWVPARLGGSAPTLEEANRMDAQEQAERAAKREPRKDDPGVV